MDIDWFYGWGRQLLSDFTNIDQGISEAEIDSFFRNSLALSDLDRYKLDEEVRHRLVDLLYKGDARRQEAIAESVQAHFAALWHALPAIYHRLRDELQANLDAGKQSLLLLNRRGFNTFAVCGSCRRRRRAERSLCRTA